MDTPQRFVLDTCVRFSSDLVKCALYHFISREKQQINVRQKRERSI
jgi:hypothetical protein